MAFGDWNGDGEVSAGEAMGTGAAIGGLLGDDGGQGGEPGGGGGVGCGEVCSNCFALAVGYLLIVIVIANLLTCAISG